jgi:hypothetical protein
VRIARAVSAAAAAAGTFPAAGSAVPVAVDIEACSASVRSRSAISLCKLSTALVYVPLSFSATLRLTKFAIFSKTCFAGTTSFLRIHSRQITPSFLNSLSTSPEVSFAALPPLIAFTTASKILS